MSYPADVPKIAAAAVVAEAATGLPAILSAAQCAVESGWLDHVPENNAFGVKWHKSQDPQQRQLVTTLEWFTAPQLQAWLADPEYAGRELLGETGNTRKDGRKEYRVKDWFMRYKSLADSFTAHAKLITTGNPYRKAWAAYQSHRSPERLAREIGNYATSPAYTETVLQVMKMRVLIAAIRGARQ